MADGMFRAYHNGTALCMGEPTLAQAQEHCQTHAEQAASAPQTNGGTP